MDRKKNARTFDIAVVVVIIAAILIYGAMLDSSTITMELADNGIGVAGPDKTTAILLYEDIVSVDYYEEFEVGDVVEETENDTVYNGTWQNALLGEYQLLAYRDCTAMIVVTTEETTFAFNGSDAAETAEYYEEILEAMGQ